LKRELFNLSNTLQFLVSLLTPVGTKKGINFKANFSPADFLSFPLFVWGDRARLEQVKIE